MLELRHSVKRTWSNDTWFRPASKNQATWSLNLGFTLTFLRSAFSSGQNSRSLRVDGSIHTCLAMNYSIIITRGAACLKNWKAVNPSKCKWKEDTVKWPVVPSASHIM